MAKNIYDLFNERKNGIDYLVEGLDPTEYNDLEAFEDLDEAAESLDALTMESTNEMIEFQAACYLEDLVLENMMYEEFDEEKISNVMEAAKEEKKEGLGQKIKNLWQRIKEWFARAFKTIVNHFQSGETLVAKYRNEIPQAMKQSGAKIKSRPLDQDPDNAIKQIKALVERAKVVGKSKEQILGLLGLSDKSGVKNKVESIFFGGKDKTEKAIKDIKPDLVMKWAANKKIFVDGLKKYQKDIDGEFKEMLAKLNKGDDENKSAMAADFQFGINIINSMLSHTVVCIKQVSSACTAVIRKALSGKYDANAKEDNSTADSKARGEQADKHAKKVGKKMADSINQGKIGGAVKKEEPKSTGLARIESWEIIDEDDYCEENYQEENHDDFEW